MSKDPGSSRSKVSLFKGFIDIAYDGPHAARVVLSLGIAGMAVYYGLCRGTPFWQVMAVLMVVFFANFLVSPAVREAWHDWRSRCLVLDIA